MELWEYAGIGPKVAHHLNINPDAKPMKQRQRKFKPKTQEATEAEMKKLKACGFIHEEQHLDWLANIVSVMRNEKVKVCIDFINLKDTCLKDNF